MLRAIKKYFTFIRTCSAHLLIQRIFAMTAQTETDNRVWSDRPYADKARLSAEPGEASMALGAIIVAVLFALSLAFWVGGFSVFKGLLHDLVPLLDWLASLFGQKL
jgi:hypothetical protein